MSEHSPRIGDGLGLTELESAALAGVAAGVDAATISEIEDVPAADVRAACVRALSLIRHPCTVLDGLPPSVIAGAAKLDARRAAADSVGVGVETDPGAAGEPCC